MKKILLLTTLMLIATTIFGMKHRGLSNWEISNAIDMALIEELKEAGYTVLPEVRVIAYRNDQDTIRHKSNYEKYWEAREKTWEDSAKLRKEPKIAKHDEIDDLYFQPEKKGRWFFEKKEGQRNDSVEKHVVVNNYYYDDNDFYYANRINRFHGGFWFNYSPFYSPYYGWNSPYFYDSWYWGYNSYWYDWYYPYYGFGWHYPYYSWYYPYYGHNYWYPSYGHVQYRTPNYGVGALGSRYYGYYSTNSKTQVYTPMQYNRRSTPSTLSQTKNVNPVERREVSPQQRVSPQDKPVYNQNRRTYSPSYEQPRMGIRPQYNNTRTSRSMEMNRSTEISTQRRTETRTNSSPNNDRPIYSRPSTGGRPSYSTPTQRSSNNNYSAPNRSSNSYSQPSRGSSYQSSPSMNRSSGNSGSFSGGGNSGSYGGGSSSGSKSGGRR